MRNRLMACLLLIGLMLGCMTAYAMEIDDCRVSFCDEYVTMRAQPSTSAREVTRVPYGAHVTNVHCNSYYDQFYYCCYNGYEGYVLSQYLLGGQEMADIWDAYIVNCHDWVSLRFRPNTKSRQLIKVPLGADVQDAYYVENGFVHCFYRGYEGYILEQYVASRY